MSLFFFAILAACSYDDTISEHAIKYNETVARADNANLLLNILRARDRHPAHFTAISLVRGSLSLETTGGVTLELPFGADSSIPVTPTLSMKQKSSPSFDVAVLDSKAFISGILSPIRMETIKYYIDQRWSPAMLFQLLIHRIRVSREFIEHGKFCESAQDGAVKKEIVKYVSEPGVAKNGFVTFVNEPPTTADRNAPSHRAFRQFLNFVRCMNHEMQAERFELRKVESGTPVGPKFRLDEKDVVGNVIRAEKESLRLVEIPGGTPPYYRLCKPKSEIIFCFENCSAPSFESSCVHADDPAGSGNAGDGKSGTTMPKSEAENAPKAASDAKTRYFREGEFGESPYAAGSAVYIRSVQNVIFHLGEILRYQEQTGDFIRADGRTMFHLTTDRDVAERPYISATYDGTTYYVPKGDAFGTKDVMTVLVQLVGQYKEASDLPTTAAVQAVGD